MVLRRADRKDGPLIWRPLLLAILAAAVWTASVRAQRPYEDLICSYPWDCAKAYRVMLCESRGDPTAYNAGNYGLFQLNAIHRARVGGDLSLFYDPETNVRVAYDLWSAQGWAPWGCRGA